MRLPGTILQGILARSALTVLRIYLGSTFLVLAWPKLTQDYSPAGFIERALESSHPVYQDFLSRVVVPHMSLFSALIGWGELLVGAALIVGLVTRLAATAALLLSLNYLLATAGRGWTPASSHTAFACIAMALIIGAAGRTFGLDTFLARRWPRSPFW